MEIPRFEDVKIVRLTTFDEAMAISDRGNIALDFYICS
jgi:hypothetical protein